MQPAYTVVEGCITSSDDRQANGVPEGRRLVVGIGRWGLGVLLLLLLLLLLLVIERPSSRITSRSRSRSLPSLPRQCAAAVRWRIPSNGLFSTIECASRTDALLSLSPGIQ